MSDQPMIHRLKVLIADDNRDAADSLAILLSVSGYEVFAAHSGRGALELALRERPDVMILDISMPDLTGLQVARRIRRQRWGQSVLLLALSGWDQPGDRENSRNAGFDLHFAKPASIERLEQMLQAYIRGRDGDPATAAAPGPVPVRDIRERTWAFLPTTS